MLGSLDAFSCDMAFKKMYIPHKKNLQYFVCQKIDQMYSLICAMIKRLERSSKWEMSVFLKFNCKGFL